MASGRTPGIPSQLARLTKDLAATRNWVRDLDAVKRELLVRTRRNDKHVRTAFALMKVCAQRLQRIE